MLRICFPERNPGSPERNLRAAELSLSETEPNLSETESSLREVELKVREVELNPAAAEALLFALAPVTVPGNQRMQYKLKTTSAIGLELFFHQSESIADRD